MSKGEGVCFGSFSKWVGAELVEVETRNPEAKQKKCYSRSESVALIDNQQTKQSKTIRDGLHTHSYPSNTSFLSFA